MIERNKSGFSPSNSGQLDMYDKNYGKVPIYKALKCELHEPLYFQGKQIAQSVQSDEITFGSEIYEG